MQYSKTPPKAQHYVVLSRAEVDQACQDYAARRLLGVPSLVRVTLDLGTDATAAIVSWETEK